MKSASLVVSRAGASTLSELIALSIPSILIPSPYVANNHQYKNALDLVNNNACYMIEERNLVGDILVDKIDEILDNPDISLKMIDSLKSMKVSNSASLVYDNIRELVDRK